MGDPGLAGEFTFAVRGITAGPGDFNAEWLAAQGFVVLPQESGMHLTSEQCVRLASSLDRFGVNREFAVVSEPLLVGPVVYELDVTADDLASFSFECGSYNFVLLSSKEDPGHAVLCSTDDYLLVAGPPEFVATFAGDLVTARGSFIDFAERHFEVVQPRLRALMKYLDWIG
jgi:hypothetical protein